MKYEHRRRFTRIRFGVPAVITVGDNIFTVKGISNLGIGGALIPCEQNFADLTECIFNIPIGDGTNKLCVEAKGEFIWSNKTEAAIKFTGIDPDSLMLLQNIIRYNAEDADDIDTELANHQGLI